MVQKLFLLLLVGCGLICGGMACGSSTDTSDSDAGGTDDSTDTTDDTGNTASGSSTSTLSTIQKDIFTPTCATGGCHSSASSSAGLSLASGESFGELVGIASTQLSTMKRVTASDTSKSYLIHKLEGTHTAQGGTGSRMPLGGTPLSTTQLQTIKDWITDGAKNN